MRRQLMVANWKMNLGVAAAGAFARGLIKNIPAVTKTDVAICPSFVAIPEVARILASSGVAIGAQNMSAEDQGALTGEVSPTMIKPFVDYVIIGHSERRRLFGERDAEIAAKVASAIGHDITPILCIGESLHERESGYAAFTVINQLEADLRDVAASEVGGIVIAYEPIWAIGTGEPIKPKDAQDMTARIRVAIKTYYGGKAADRVRILYGGSVSAENIADFINLSDIDGALVGGASIHLDEWLKILNIVQNPKPIAHSPKPIAQSPKRKSRRSRSGG